MAIKVTVNGSLRSTGAAPDTPLLYVLRDDLELRGPKFGCGLSQCGACSVLLDFDRSNVTSLDWNGYPIIRFTEAPTVDVIPIDQQDLPVTGSGEPSCNPVAPAIANAVFDAVGVRLRTLPMAPDRVKAALNSVTTTRPTAQRLGAA